MASRITRSNSAVVENVDVSIERWQAGTIVRKTDETGTGPIGSLFNSLIELLGLILVDMKTRSNVPRHYQSLESSSAALFFWGVDLNVSQGELDETLRDSPELRDTCLMVLASITHFTTSSLVGLVSSKARQKELLHSTAILASWERANNILDQPYYPKHKPEQEEERLCRTLRAKIDNLIILEPSLASPAEEDLDDQEPRTIEHNEEHVPEQAFINSVAQRFPEAAASIVTRLGKLNWERYDHILHLQRTSNQQELEPSALEKARTIFHDSGLGSSAPAKSELGLTTTNNPSSFQPAYAPSVISSRAEASHKRLPPLPAEGRLGLHFTCAICNKQVRYQRTKAWKKHIFDDILAYACPFAGCPIAGVFFQDHDTMMDHLEQHHDLNVSSGEISCPICIKFTSSDRDALSLHISRHMEEIALTILPSVIDSDHDSADNTSSEARTDVVEHELSPDSGGERQSHSGTLSTDGPLQEPKQDQFTAAEPRRSDLASEVFYDSPFSSDEDLEKSLRPKRSTRRILTSPARTGPKAPRLDRFGATRLARESEKGDLDAVKEAYEEAPDELNLVDYANIAPLQKASLHGWADVVRYLIAKGCNTACESNDRDTPLIDAVENGHLEVVKLLLEANANPHHQNRKGQRAIDVIDLEDEHGEEIKQILEKSMRTSPESSSPKKRDFTPRLLYNEYNVETLIEKAGDGDINAVGELMNSNIKPNLASGIAAARGGHYDILSILLASGLKHDFDPAKHSETPMTVAIRAGHVNIVQLLLEQDGFDPTRRNRKGKTYHQIAEEEKASSNWETIRNALAHAFSEYQSSSKAIRRSPLSTFGVEPSGAAENSPASPAPPPRRRLITAKEKASREEQRRNIANDSFDSNSRHSSDSHSRTYLEMTQAWQGRYSGTAPSQDPPLSVTHSSQQVVFSLPDSNTIQPPTRRIMTEEETLGYRRARKRGACSACRPQKGKCTHVQGAVEARSAYDNSELDDKRSRVIARAAAADALETYEQALSWLNLTPDLSDDFVVSMFSVKIADDPESAETTRRALSLIAEHRNSNLLRKYLNGRDFLLSGDVRI